MSHRKIKRVPLEKSKKGRLKTPTDESPYSMIQHPVFCFRYLHKKHNLTGCSNSEKIKLLEKLAILSTLPWSVIHNSPRHGNGTEKINQTSIRPGIPQHITKDVNFYAIRFQGKKPIVGYKTGVIFHIVYIDINFTVYKH